MTSDLSGLPSLHDLIAALPEVYQPIFGHPQYALTTSRGLDDRLIQVTTVYNALAARLGRPLRVLDLGCAQGWFCFNLAKAGAQVVGIDVLAANINVCNRLAIDNRGLNVRFQLAEIEHIPQHVTGGQFDLVLGLSVFHHLCYHNGKQAARDLVQAIFAKVPSGIVELAIASEPVSWAASLPENPDYLIEHVPFFRVLSHHATHLSDVKRPLYFCSREFWYLGGIAEKFDHWIDNKRGRRCYMNASVIAMLYSVTGESGGRNRNAIVRSAQFLEAPPPGYPVLPKVFQTGEEAGVAWLVREKIQGTSLQDLINAGQPYDAQIVLRDTLRQLAALQAAGLFHADLRVWNIIVGPNSNATLIDYNEISGVDRDCVWPWSVFSSFFIFARDVITRTISKTHPIREPFISPYNLPEPYRNWGAALWNKPVDEWTFAELLRTLDALPTAESGKPMLPPDGSAVALWIKEMEEYTNVTVQDLCSLESSFRQMMEKVVAHSLLLQKRIHALEMSLGKGNTEGQPHADIPKEKPISSPTQG